MSDAKMCDRCKKFYIEEKYDMKKRYIVGRPILRIAFYTWGISGNMDLCPVCSDLLRDFLGRNETCLK